MYIELAILALFTFLYSVVAGRIDKLPVSGPIVFVITGLMLGPLGLGWFKDDVSRVEFRMLVDLTPKLPPMSAIIEGYQPPTAGPADLIVPNALSALAPSSTALARR